MTEGQPHSAVLVVGGSGSLGRAICTRFADAGHDVLLTYCSNAKAAEESAQAIVEVGVHARALELDLRDADRARSTIDELFRQYSGLRTIVYAAGPSLKWKYVSTTTQEEWTDAFRVDVEGGFAVLSAALPHLRPRSGASIVALTAAAIRRPPPTDILSVAPKAAIDLLIKTIAKEEGKYGTRANAIEVGYINAGLAQEALDKLPTEVVDRVIAGIPMGEFGTADDVADAAVFLASERASYITGQALAVDGGFQI